MTVHGCTTYPCPICAGSTTATLSGTTWNGGSCQICGALYLGIHSCSVEDLIRRSDELRELAARKFDQEAERGTPVEVKFDRTAGCPCRTENGGSGVCGCILGGPRVTC